MKKFIFLNLLFLSLLVSSCSDDNSTTNSQEQSQETFAIITNQGQWTKGTASISQILRDGTVNNDVFKAANNNRPLGDVAQSISYINGFYYIILNGSSKIEVVKPDTFESVATILLDKASPRCIEQISETEAVVSDLNKKLHIINLTDNSVKETINLNGYSLEFMCYSDNKLFSLVSIKGELSMVVFDVDNIKSGEERKITFDYNKSAAIPETVKLIKCADGKIRTFANSFNKGYIVCFNPVNETFEETFEFSTCSSSDTEIYKDGCITGFNYYPRIDTDGTKSKLYFDVNTLKGTNTNNPFIYTYDINSQELKPYIELKDLKMMYGMGVSKDGDVYVCDCLDYSAQRGYIRHYKKDGTVINDIVGVYPNGVLFIDKLSAWKK